MSHWLLKTEPDEFSWDQLRAAGRRGETWDGIRNHQAAGFLRQMRKGEQVFIYHTGKERRVVGIGELVREAFPDAEDSTGRFVAVTVRAVAALTKPVSLADIKAEPALAALMLLRQGRLSVVPVTVEEWGAIVRLARE